MVVLMGKEDILMQSPDIKRPVVNEILCTSMNGRVNPPRENSTKDSDSTLKDHSTLSLSFLNTDTLISSTIETWSSRQAMEETPKSGGSTKSL